MSKVNQLNQRMNKNLYSYFTAHQVPILCLTLSSSKLKLLWHVFIVLFAIFWFVGLSICLSVCLFLVLNLIKNTRSLIHYRINIRELLLLHHIWLGHDVSVTVSSILQSSEQLRHLVVSQFITFEAVLLQPSKHRFHAISRQLFPNFKSLAVSSVPIFMHNNPQVLRTMIVFVE